MESYFGSDSGSSLALDRDESLVRHLAKEQLAEEALEATDTELPAAWLQRRAWLDFNRMCCPCFAWASQLLPPLT